MWLGKLLPWALCGLLSFACTPTVSPEAQQVGPAGATVSLGVEATCVIPPNALGSVTSVKIRKLDTAEGAALLSGFEARSAVYEFTPHGQAFLTPVTIELAFEGDAAIQVLRKATPDALGWQLIDATVSAGKARFETSAFSYYAVASAGQDGGTVDAGDACAAILARPAVVDAKQAFTALQSASSAVSHCTAAVGCHGFQPDSAQRNCYGVANGQATTNLANADAVFFGKYWALTAEERACYSIVTVGCPPFHCVNDQFCVPSGPDPGPQDAGSDAGTSDAGITDGGVDCVALNAGAGLTAAKAAMSALQTENYNVGDCSVSNACTRFPPGDGGTCTAVSTDKSTATLVIRQNDFYQKYNALSADEQSCYRLVSFPCPGSFACVGGRCQ
jgi:hypothetical protein